MRILALFLVLLALSTERAAADWTIGGRSDNLVYYVDRTTIQRTGDHALMWNLTDYNTPQVWQGQAFLSSKAQFEYDCSRARSRVMEEAGYAEHMGKGQRTYAVQGPRAWQTAGSGTVAETKLRIACGQGARENKD